MAQEQNPFSGTGERERVKFIFWSVVALGAMNLLLFFLAIGFSLWLFIDGLIWLMFGAYLFKYSASESVSGAKVASLVAIVVSASVALMIIADIYERGNRIYF